MVAPAMLPVPASSSVIATVGTTLSVIATGAAVASGLPATSVTAGSGSIVAPLAMVGSGPRVIVRTVSPTLNTAPYPVVPNIPADNPNSVARVVEVPSVRVVGSTASLKVTTMVSVPEIAVLASTLFQAIVEMEGDCPSVISVDASCA